MEVLDPDNTHNRLFAQRIKNQILTLLKNALSTRGIYTKIPQLLGELTASLLTTNPSECL